MRGFATKPIECEDNGSGTPNGENGSGKPMSLPITIQERTSITETIEEVEEESGWEVNEIFSVQSECRL